ncbi:MULTISPECIES: RecQ family ATP-dependent DNA helicase [Aerococcus]|uniref:RecQ family ATP-dependent DNA helicase n=1 Tax=Aerococcus TaxID=1375 RepID=UPI0018E1295C|nr:MULTISPECIES: RecQ family ATP-dependent DNA helicase [Aerococcus]MCY3036530.1 RecQ family ATP-dependent DNA helicase [Aerococcus sp. Group 2]MCY3039491.1 RecQ family ATP-dependent DNA helicase [Aerococcus sp. Group 2]MCY3041393.1 RecQ family ATP-dependent DNA helicase [Aerococcus sp. Group 2]MCY3042945.1 RecQ family ATP-dependent DNA helicase [Aerococcus sp. Group 2]MDK6520586.1 RecQ family ATP-dependent DNA helicase [Aerococcus urinae]
MLEDLLANHFGYQSFRPGQKEILLHLQKRENTIGILPTAGGKSLIYQIYQYLNPGPILLISPLLALMEDQVSQLQALGFKASVAITSQLSKQEKNWLLHHLHDFQFIIMSPEMLSQPAVLRRLRQIAIKLMVIDEAHCISQWGYDFRPEYSALRQFRQALNHPLTLALSGSASQNTLAEIAQHLFSDWESYQQVQCPLDRPNLFYGQLKLNEKDKFHHLNSLLETLPKPGIIYVHNKMELEELYQDLKASSQLKLASYHADKTSEERLQVQEQFQKGHLDAILATSAFGMGINQANVRFVIHYHAPQSLADYLQESGRCGRDGQEALVLLYSNPQEISRLNYFKDQIDAQASPFYQGLNQAYQRADFLQSQTFLALEEQIQNLITYFYYNYSPQDKERIQKDFQNYQKIKKNEIEQMIQYLTLNSCYRRYLLSHFSKERISTNRFCCSHCQADFEDTATFKEYLTLAPNRLVNPKEKVLKDWRARLNVLFPS